MSAEVQVEGMEEVEAKIRQVVEDLGNGDLVDAMKRSVIVVEGAAKIKAPVNIGRLRGSITHGVTQNPLTGVVGSNVHYAPHVEFPTKPHWPPFEPISYWVQRKLQIPPAAKEHYAVVRGVQAAIARRGTRAQQYLIGALEENVGRIQHIFERVVGGIVEK